MKVFLTTTALAFLCAVSSAAVASEGRRDPAEWPASVQMFKKVSTINDVHHANQTEIQLANMAQGMITDTELKTFSQMLVADHQKSDADWLALATTTGSQFAGFVPSEVEQSAMSRLQQLGGTEFDLAYVDFQRIMHRCVASKLKVLISEEKDSKMKDLLVTTLRSVKEHERMAAKIETRLRQGT